MTDDIDDQIVHALQVAPRAPWGAVGDVLGISAATASRRWDRLVENGLAWIVTYPGVRTSTSAAAHLWKYTPRRARKAYSTN
ncbi:AsnC family protein [Williamsia sp. DF01-3]|uniref:AsnC family protein n=1 Tax=Williamsia sp. DF01-3 TaxID=2934157 RepID=UPI001FF4A929|nr:AsnC family protein [Williamsia sp. DF01-3]MCK0520443.1 AsnC family protein [Williamsia sp. DF01-3]